MKITYIAHSGFSVELSEHVLLFDYFTGSLPEWDEDKQLLVFASHKHQDHFSAKIFELAGRYRKIHFVFGSDIRLKAEWLAKKGVDPAVLSLITVMKAGENSIGTEISGVRIGTLKSTDTGAAFLVEAEGKRFYHAGDLNWWHWEGEDKAWNRNMEVNYKRQIDRIEGMRFDAAFVPLDPRLGDAYGLGMDYFLEKTDAERIFPMHMWEEYGFIGRYKEQAGRNADRLVEIHERGEHFIFQEK